MAQRNDRDLPIAASNAVGPGGRALRVLKLYDEVRTAHLERIPRDTATVILYRRRRYDFDEGLAARVSLQRAGAWRTLWWTLRHRVDAIEISEPFVTGAAARSLAAIVGSRARSALSGEDRARIVSYAIESLHPSDAAPHLPAKARLRGALQRLLVPFVWHGIDRLALGTRAAVTVYERSFRHTWPEHRLIPALPAAGLSGMSTTPRDQSVVFLGDLSERKGFPDLLQAWPHVQARVPGARMLILGQGVEAAAAAALAARDHRVSVMIEPPRDVIFAQLARAKVLVLPSRRMPLWREQVGLPIVEGLSSGCAIVTTTETGLADWLAEHGHHVVDPIAGEPLCEAIVAALEGGRSPADIVADLPAVDGRAAAEAWLLEGVR